MIRKRGRSVSNTSTEELIKSMLQSDHVHMGIKNNTTSTVGIINQTKMSLSSRDITNFDSSLPIDVPAKDLIATSNEGAAQMWNNELNVNALSTDAQPQEQRSCSGSAVKKSWRHSKKGKIYAQTVSNLLDVLLRMCMFLVFIKLERSHAFRRKILPEEMWMFKNPRMPDIVSAGLLVSSVLLAPFCVTIVQWLHTRNTRDFRAANWAWTLSVCLNGVTTSSLKIIVGRPRPDFFYRCFPSGVLVLNNITNNDGTMDFFNCTGVQAIINEGYKSFPSGHASFSFAAFGFLTFYIGAKLNAFNKRGRGQSWRLCLAMLPLAVATFIAVSRTCDYHHHWQDVSFGGIWGLFLSYYIYRQYYPSIFESNCQQPYYRGHNITATEEELNSTDMQHVQDSFNASNVTESSPLMQKNL